MSQTFKVFTLPVYDEDGDITGSPGALLVSAKEIILVDGEDCWIGQAVRGVGVVTSYPEARRYNRKTDTIERYVKHLVVYGFHPVTGEAYPPSFYVWQRIED